jgi:glycosyltransferase involved in cell wall biosynthesis
VSYRILYHHRTQALDGQRVHITTIQRALRQLGHEVLEVSPLPAVEAAGGASVPTLRRRVLEKVAAATPKGAYEGLELAYNFVGFRALASAIRTFKPDFIYERYALNTVAGAWASKRYGVPLLLEVNSPLADEKRALGQLLFYRASRRLEAYVLNRATRVLAVTQVLADILHRSAGLPEQRTVVVHNGTDPEVVQRAAARRAAVRSELGFQSDAVVLGSVGFFREWHGVDQMLDAFAAVRRSSPRTRVLLVGEGPAIPSLQQLVTTHGLTDDVRFTGAVAHDRIPEFLAAMDVVVIPRAVEYASPLKLFEYMAAGKAILAPRQPNLLEVITEDHDALCFRPGDERELLGLIQKVVDDAALRRALGEAAQITIDARQLTWIGNAQRIIDTFEAATRGREHASV